MLLEDKNADHHRGRLGGRPGLGAALRRGGRQGRVRRPRRRRRQGDGPADRGRPAGPRCRSPPTCPRRTTWSRRSRAVSEQLRPARHRVQQRRHPDAAARHAASRTTPPRTSSGSFAVNVGGVFYGCKHAVVRFKEQGDGGVIVNTGSVAGLVGWGGTVYGATKGAVHQLTKAVAIEAAPFGIRVNAICPAGMPYTGLHGRRRRRAPGRRPGRRRRARSGPATRSAGPSPPRTAPRRPCSSPRTGPANITGVLLPVDGGYVAR